MNKVVLVTGSSRGIGAATIKEFASHNYDVIINYKSNKEEALKLQSEIESQYKVKTMLIKCDVSNEEEVLEMVNSIIKAFGQIDVLVNNAGIAIDTSFNNKTVANFQKILNVNLIGTFLVSKYVSKYMLERKSGVIINVSSTNGIDTYYPMSLDYDASKAGVISLTHNLAKEFAPFIRVNSVAPGWVNTPMNDNLENNFKQNETEKIMLKRFAESYEIAKVIYFLASEEASYINNEIIKVDGGNLC